MTATPISAGDFAPGDPAPGSLGRAGFFLGFGLGGFFDGILLHQVLQWHHLLSAVQDSRLQSIEIQILADGLFHVVMYLIALLGLWLLWRSRQRLAAAVAGRHLLGSAFIGFGVWHLLDGILSHWILGLHRIRMDAANPLLWDLAWFVLFGVVFVVIGWILRKRSSTSGGGSSGTLRNVAAAAMLALAVLVAGPVAALPPPNAGTVLVFFRPDITSARIFQAMDAAGARILWAADGGRVWALEIGEAGDMQALYRHGAYFVSNSAVAIGCVAWTRARSTADAEGTGVSL